MPVRTVRFYISEGLLPRPEGRGKGGGYGQEHLLRLRLVRLLVEQRVPLGEIRTRLAQLSVSEVRTLLAEQERCASELERAERAPSPRAYVSALLARARAGRMGAAEAGPRYSDPALRSMQPATPPSQHSAVTDSEAVVRGYGTPPTLELDLVAWHRIELAPGVELHVRRDAEGQHPELIRLLLSLAGRARIRRS